MPQPPRTTDFSPRRYAKPARGWKLFLSAFQNPRALSDLRRRGDVERRRWVEAARVAVLRVVRGALVVVAKTEVERQPIRDLPIVLHEEPVIHRDVEPCRVAVERAARRQAEHERREILTEDAGRVVLRARERRVVAHHVLTRLSGGLRSEFLVHPQVVSRPNRVIADDARQRRLERVDAVDGRCRDLIADVGEQIEIEVRKILRAAEERRDA